jgi:AAA domain, putative AbiEii toxin, Type IV TA system/AAA domain
MRDVSQRRGARVLKSLSVKNFRCFQSLSVQRLGSINLISGRNAAGKTSLLEAIFLLAGGPNVSLAMTLSALRGIGVGESIRGDLAALREIFLQPLFLRFGPKASIDISGVHDRLGRVALSLQVTPEEATELPLDALTTGPSRSAETETPKAYALRAGYTGGSLHTTTTLKMTLKGPVMEPTPSEMPFPATFLASGHRENIQEDAGRLGRLEVYKKEIDLVANLRPLEPRLQRLLTVALGGVPVIHGDVQLDRLLPLALMGDGVRRLTSILLTIATSQNGLVLIDELENGIHHSALSRAWKAIGDAAESANVQIFATTHSFECIRAAHDVFGSWPKFSLHRMERVRDDIQVRTYDSDALAAAMKAELEVR